MLLPFRNRYGYVERYQDPGGVGWDGMDVVRVGSGSRSTLMFFEIRETVRVECYFCARRR